MNQELNYDIIQRMRTLIAHIRFLRPLDPFHLLLVVCWQATLDVHIYESYKCADCRTESVTVGELLGTAEMRHYHTEFILAEFDLCGLVPFQRTVIQMDICLGRTVPVALAVKVCTVLSFTLYTSLFKFPYHQRILRICN